MDPLLSALSAADYVRTPLPLSHPVVIHAVAGAGKTSLLVRLLASHPEICVRTHANPSPLLLEGRRILHHDEPPTGAFNILDEYAAAPTTHYWDALLCDPLQHPPQNCLPAHYTCHFTWRFPPDTCEFLSSLGFHLNSRLPPAGVPTVHPGGIFSSPLHGQVICLDQPTLSLARDHGLRPLTPHQALGQEFPTVTVLSAVPLASQPCREAVYIALTRHTHDLHVLTPDPSGST